MNQTRIEICGSIGSGKTTLATHLAPALGGKVVFEDFSANPFWGRYYAQPEVFRPEKDVCFLAQHTGEIKAAGPGIIVCDYAPIQDLAYAQLAEDPEHLTMMYGIYRQLYETLPPPALIIYLGCDTNDLIRRIQRRGRTEEQSIKASYLEKIEILLVNLLKKIGILVFPIRSDQVDFINNSSQTDKLFAAISQRVSDKLHGV